MYRPHSTASLHRTRRLPFGQVMRHASGGWRELAGVAHIKIDCYGRGAAPHPPVRSGRPQHVFCRDVVEFCSAPHWSRTGSSVGAAYAPTGSCSIRPSIATGTDVSGLPKRIAAQEGTGRKHIETGREVDESTGTGRHPAAVFLQNPATRRTSVSAQGPFQNYRHSAPARTWFEDDNRVLPDGCIRRSVSDRRVCARGAGADGPSVAAGPPDRSRRCRTW